MPYLQVHFGKIHAFYALSLFLTVTLISALLSGRFQVVCFPHNFSRARVRPRSLRHYREYAHFLSAASDANEQCIQANGATEYSRANQPWFARGCFVTAAMVRLRGEQHEFRRTER